jgi:phage portal protein BeeE
MYADAPRPLQVLRNVSNYELSDDEITGLLTDYVKARQESSVAYLNGGVELDTLGWDAQQTALVAQRNESAIQIARLLNLDPMWLGAAVSGSSLTYQNRVDARQDLVDLTLSDYMVPFEQRISMRDVCGQTVRHDTSEFLRANLTERSRIAVELTGAGIITPQEAALFVSDRPTGGPA